MSEFATDYAQKTRLLEEITRLEAQLADVMRASSLEHARMAALIEACEAVAEFIESYAPDSSLARYQPTFYANLRVYGKNARAAVEAGSHQALALIKELEAARAFIHKIRIVPIVGGWTDEQSALLAAYDEATKKARE